MNESAGTVTLTVQLSAAAAVPVTVAYSSSDGNATGGGADYRVDAGSLTFAPGETQKVRCRDARAGCAPQSM